MKEAKWILIAGAIILIFVKIFYPVIVPLVVEIELPETAFVGDCFDVRFDIRGYHQTCSILLDGQELDFSTAEENFYEEWHAYGGIDGDQCVEFEAWLKIRADHPGLWIFRVEAIGKDGQVVAKEDTIRVSSKSELVGLF